MIYKEPDYELGHKIVNKLNVKNRHCKIVNVRLKTGVKWADKPWSELIKTENTIPEYLRFVRQQWVM